MPRTTQKKSPAKRTKTLKKGPTKGLGRPKGSQTRPKPSVLSVPPACPCCHSTKSKQQPGRGPIEKEIVGELPATGQRYTSVTWRHKICNNCGQFFTEKTYHYDPEKWKS